MFLYETEKPHTNPIDRNRIHSTHTSFSSDPVNTERLICKYEIVYVINVFHTIIIDIIKH